jgi:hypothetical protein
MSTSELSELLSGMRFPAALSLFLIAIWAARASSSVSERSSGVTLIAALAVYCTATGVIWILLYATIRLLLH